MLRALVWKEWRELRLLRLTGLGLGLVLPIAFLLGAEGFRRGLLPFGGKGGYSLVDLFHHLLPSALALALWPLFSLLTVAQAFCADRASGRETFLLERPVGRGRVFLARALASVGSVLVIVLGTAAVGWAIARLTTGSVSDSKFSAELLVLGIVIAIVALLVGLGAAALLQSPMAAVLLALVLAAIPFVLGTQLGGLFPLAAVGAIPVGFVLPWLLLPAYAVAAWLGLCRGEPAGRGRVGRSLGTIAASLGTVLLGFPIVAAASVRLGTPMLWTAASPRSEAAVLLGGGYASRGWIVDLHDGDKLRFLPPPVRYAVWNEDGSRVAVVTRSGPLGSLDDQRIEIYDAKGSAVRAPIPVPEALHLVQTVWVAGDLVAVANRRSGKDEAAELLFLHVENGATTARPLPGSGWSHALLGPTTSGALYLASVTDASSGSGGTELRAVDAPGRAVAAAPVYRDATARPGGSLSPSGRYWVRVDRGDGPRPARVVDLESASEVEGFVGRRAVWLHGEKIASIEQASGAARLLVARPGERPRAIAEWTRACVDLERSPAGDAAIVHVRADKEGVCVGSGEPGASGARQDTLQRREAPEVVVYEAEVDRLVVVPLTEREQESGTDVHWAGARTLALVGVRGMALADLENLSERRFVSGRL
jgi:hypothetical protein